MHLFHVLLHGDSPLSIADSRRRSTPGGLWWECTPNEATPAIARKLRMAQAEYPKFLIDSNSRGRQPPQIAALPVCPLEIYSKSLGLADKLSVLHPSICHENVNSASSLCNVEPSQLGSCAASGEELRAVPGPRPVESLRTINDTSLVDLWGHSRALVPVPLGSTGPERSTDADLPRTTRDRPIQPF